MRVRLLAGDWLLFFFINVEMICYVVILRMLYYVQAARPSRACVRRQAGASMILCFYDNIIYCYIIFKQRPLRVRVRRQAGARLLGK